MAKPLSRRQVTCSDCGEMFDRYAYLEQHYERKHPGKPCREKRQASIVDLFKTGSKRPHQLPSDEGEPMDQEYNAEDPGPSKSTYQPLPHSSIQTIQSKPNEEQPSCHRPLNNRRTKKKHFCHKFKKFLTNSPKVVMSKIPLNQLLYCLLYNPVSKLRRKITK